MFVLAGPQSQFTEDEFKHIKVMFEFCNKGNSQPENQILEV